MDSNKCRVLLFHSMFAKDSYSDSDFRIAPIGLFFIAGALKEHGFEPLIIPVILPVFLEESTLSLEYKENLRDKIQSFNPDYIGYSFRNLYNFGPPLIKTNTLTDFFCVSQDLPVINFIRDCSNAPIIGGGSGFSLAPQFYMTYLNLDYGIQGEGENSIVMLLDNLNQDLETDMVPGLVFRRGDEVIKNDRNHCDNDKLWKMDLSCLNNLKEIYHDNGGYGSIQTKRGCAFHCSYCVYPYLEGQKYRLRPVQQIISDIKTYLHNYKIEHIYFVDSVFSSPSDHSLDIVEAIIENRLDINWYAYVNPFGLTPELLQKYKESGCSGLVLTLESGSDKVLKYLKKGFSTKESVVAIENLINAKIPFEVSMLIGSQEESEDTLNETLLFCQNYLKNIPVTFTPGVWMHPISPIFSDFHKSNNQDVDELSKLILSNDFKSHNELHYFFTKQNNRLELIQMFSKAVDKEPMWFIIGKDIVPDYHSGIMRFPNNDKIERYSRPWYSALL